MKGRMHAAHRKGRCGKDAPQTTEPTPEERGTPAAAAAFRSAWQEFYTFSPWVTQRWRRPAKGRPSVYPPDGFRARCQVQAGRAEHGARSRPQERHVPQRQPRGFLCNVPTAVSLPEPGHRWAQPVLDRWAPTSPSDTPPPPPLHGTFGSSAQTS